MLILLVDYPKYSHVSLDSFAQAIGPKPNDFKNILSYGTIPNWLSHGLETQSKQAMREVCCFYRPCPSSLAKAIYYDCEERKYWGFSGVAHVLGDSEMWGCVRAWNPAV